VADLPDAYARDMKATSNLACCLFAIILAAPTQGAEWLQTWGAAPLPPTPAMGPFPASPAFANQTVRQVVRISAGGRRIRLRITNEFGTKPLHIGALRVAIADDEGEPRPGTERQVRFAGEFSVFIPPGAPYLSDPVDLPVAALSSLSISVYLPDETGQCTCHATGLQTSFVSEPGDFTDKAFVAARTMEFRAFVSGVEVEAARAARAVVVLGDSISDGVGSTVDANRRWPDLLANRLNAKGAKGWGVVNMGISGNRVLADGAGESALVRFDRDVLSTPGLKALIIFEGVNDLGVSYGKFDGPLADLFKSLASGDKATAHSMIAGYRQLIARAHARGVKVLVATILPYGGSFYYSDDGEAVRQATNAWIRSSGEPDAVLDFDAVIRDPAKPGQMKTGFHSGDFLHGSDAGYAALAASVDLSLFR
jgi:lysophospholipase L1-like esterase